MISVRGGPLELLLLQLIMQGSPPVEVTRMDTVDSEIEDPFET